MKHRINETQLRTLKDIYRTPALREELENMISLALKVFDRIKVDVGDGRAKDMVSVFALDSSKAIFEIHNLTEEECMVYPTLDVELSRILTHSPERPAQKSLEFIHEDGGTISKEVISGSAIEIAYGFEKMDVINFLEENTHLFPNSTRTKIENCRERASKKSNISKITNDFEYRVYLASLPEEFEKETFISHLYYFDWIGNWTEKTQTHYYMYKAIKKKYPGVEAGTLKGTFIDVMNSVAYTIVRRKGHWSNDTEKFFVEISEKDPEFLSDFMDLTTTRNATEIALEVIRESRGGNEI